MSFTLSTAADSSNVLLVYANVYMNYERQQIVPGSDRRGPIAFARTCKSRNCVENAMVSDVNLDDLSIGYLSSQSDRASSNPDVTTRFDRCYRY